VQPPSRWLILNLQRNEAVSRVHRGCGQSEISMAVFNDERFCFWFWFSSGQVLVGNRLFCLCSGGGAIWTGRWQE
jgi:hypothetical protein